MAKNKSIQKAERESLNIKDKLLETLKASAPEVFAEGEALMSQNAVKHGIFARDLIITSGDGKED